MAEHPNASVVRQMFQAFRDADAAAIQSVIPEDAVWHFPGHHGQLAGEHRGREAIFAFLLKVQALTNHSFHLDLIDVVANDDRAIAIFRGHGTRDGRTLDNPTCLHIVFKDGRIAEFWEFVWDLYSVDDFWA